MGLAPLFTVVIAIVGFASTTALIEGTMDPFKVALLINGKLEGAGQPAIYRALMGAQELRMAGAVDSSLPAAARVHEVTLPP
jgi:hypothetical protein